MLWLGLEWMVPCLIWGQLLTSLDANEWCKECQARLDSFIRSFIHPFIHLCFVPPARVCWVCRWGWHPSLLSPCWTQRASGCPTNFFCCSKLSNRVTFLIVVTDWLTKGAWTREGLCWLTVWEDMCYHGAAAMATAWGSWSHCTHSQGEGKRARNCCSALFPLFFFSLGPPSVTWGCP